MSKTTPFGLILSPYATWVRDCIYGENRHQRASLYRDVTVNPLAIAAFEIVGEDEKMPPSYNSFVDVHRALQTMKRIVAGMWVNNFRYAGEAPFVATVGKHGNLCGAGVSLSSPAEAVRKMEEGDTIAAHGGVTMVNFTVTDELAGLMLQHGLPADSTNRLIDVVCAPDFTPEAIAVLRRKKCRILRNPALAAMTDAASCHIGGRIIRQVEGGYLVQDDYRFVLDLTSSSPTVPYTIHNAAELPSRERLLDMVLAWAICWTSNSNTITLVRDGMLIGNGVGQQDRVGGAFLALWRSGRMGNTIDEKVVAASDSFFPFPDGLEALAKAGVKYIFATEGSVNFAAVKAAAETHGVTFITCPDELARGFYGH